MTSRQCLLGTGQIRNLQREMGLERWQPCSHYKPRGSRRFPLQPWDGDWVLLRASKEARLAEDSEGTGPTTMECPGLAGQRQTQPLPMDPSSKIRPGVLTTPC